MSIAFPQLRRSDPEAAALYAETAQPLLTVLRDRESGERRLEALRWGLIPSWATNGRIGYKTANAMGETVATRSVYRGAFKRRRCLVPADSFYEWKKIAGAKTKQPYRFAMADETPFAFAGLWERWKRPETGEMVKSFTIITCRPNALCATVHNRMPVILDPADYPAWLGETPTAGDELRALLRPFLAELMAAHEVGRGSAM